MVSQLTGTPTLFVRKQAKTHGTCRLAEGADVDGRSVVLVEDVITTGGAVRDAARGTQEGGRSDRCRRLRHRRSPRGQHPLRDAGIEVRSMLTRAELDRARQAAPGP